jgi:NDP-sugar pyrophosphorylase family protein
MLLTAGFGLRMLPLTRRLPKAALPVLGRPIALQILEQLAQIGIERVVLNLHHLPLRLRRLVEEAKGARLPEIFFTEEEKILGTAGGIGNAAHLLRGEGPILVRNSDFLADIDIPTLLERHRRSGMEATLVLARQRPGYSTVEIDKEGRITAIPGRRGTDSGYLFTGCHIIEESVLERIPAEVSSDIVRDVYQDLSAKGVLGSYIHEGFWWEFGTPDLLLDGSQALIELDEGQRARIACCDPVRRLDSTIAAVGRDVKCHETAQLRAWVALGASSSIGESASVEESILMPGAVVGDGCRLKRAILAPGVRLQAGSTVEDELICP